MTSPGGFKYSGLPVNPLPQKILLVRLSAIGDVVNTIPSLRALRRAFPNAHIAWMVEDRALGVIESDPDLDACYVFERKKWNPRRTSRPLPRSLGEALNFVRMLRRAKFDVALDFQGNTKSGLLTWLSGARRRIGFPAEHGKECGFLFVNERAAVLDGAVHRVEKSFSLVRLLTNPGEPRPPDIPVDEAALSNAERALAAVCGTERPRIALHPGSSRSGRFKRWPTGSYARLGDMLAERFHARVLVVCGPDEPDLADEIAARMSHDVFPAPPAPTLRGLAAVLKCVDLLVGSDSGPAHLASAVGTPVVAIFGPKDPNVYAPYGPNNAVVRAAVPCSPCKRRKCDRMECMTSLSAEVVYDTVKRVLIQLGQRVKS